MEALDGNAIAGTLIEVFGTEMTAAVTVCAGCGRTGQVAGLAVYPRGPGIVARCPGCTAVVMVFTKINGVTCVDLSGLARLG